VLSSLLLSVLGVGIKLNAAKELVQVVGRRKELKANLLLLQSRLGDESKNAWIDNATYDMKLRQDRIVEMELASSLSYSSMECEAIDIGTAMFAAFESTGSSEGVKQMEHSAAMDRVETKVDRRSGHLLARATAEVCASAQEIAAHALTYCSSRFGQHTSALDPNIVHAESITVHGCHTVTFFRFKAPGMSDRTFLNSIVAKKMAAEPPQYLISMVPIPNHAEIDPKKEARAVRGDAYRSFRCTEVMPGRTKMEYVCTLDLRGLVPQLVTDTVAIPAQCSGAHPRTDAAML
jgi:hypothetical protein